MAYVPIRLPCNCPTQLTVIPAKGIQGWMYLFILSFFFFFPQDHKLSQVEICDLDGWFLLGMGCKQGKGRDCWLEWYQDDVAYRLRRLFLFHGTDGCPAHRRILKSEKGMRAVPCCSADQEWIHGLKTTVPQDRLWYLWLPLCDFTTVEV